MMHSECGDGCINGRRSPMFCRRVALPILVFLALTGPVAAQMPPPMGGLSSPSPLQPGDAFGEEVTLPERTIVYLKGHSTWDVAFDTLVDSFKSLNEYLNKQGIKPNGPAMTVYTQTDDSGFQFEAAVPIAAAPAQPPEGQFPRRPGPPRGGLKIRAPRPIRRMDS